MYLFQGYFGNFFHTGDFRYSSAMFTETLLSNQNLSIDRLYLDNTYCSPKYDFPERATAFDSITTIIDSCKDCDVLIGMRKLGKEDMLVRLAFYYNTWIVVKPDYYQSLQPLELPNVFTTDVTRGFIHVVPLHNVSVKQLRALNVEKKTIAIVPSSLHHTRHCQKNRPSLIHYVSYSDHSSYKELHMFVSRLKPAHVIPLVDKIGLAKEAADISCFDIYLQGSPMQFSVPDSVQRFMRSSSDRSCAQKKKKRVQSKHKIRQAVKGVHYESAAVDELNSVSTGNQASHKSDQKSKTTSSYFPENSHKLSSTDGCRSSTPNPASYAKLGGQPGVLDLSLHKPQVLCSTQIAPPRKQSSRQAFEYTTSKEGVTSPQDICMTTKQNSKQAVESMRSEEGVISPQDIFEDQQTGSAPLYTPIHPQPFLVNRMMETVVMSENRSGTSVAAPLVHLVHIVSGIHRQVVGNAQPLNSEQCMGSVSLPMGSVSLPMHRSELSDHSAPLHDTYQRPSTTQSQPSAVPPIIIKPEPLTHAYNKSFMGEESVMTPSLPPTNHSDTKVQMSELLDFPQTQPFSSSSNPNESGTPYPCTQSFLLDDQSQPSCFSPTDPVDLLTKTCIQPGQQTAVDQSWRSCIQPIEQMSVDHLLSRCPQPTEHAPDQSLQAEHCSSNTTKCSSPSSSDVPCPSNGSDSRMLPTRDCSTDRQDASIKVQSSLQKDSVPIPIVDPHIRRDNSTANPNADLQADVAHVQSTKECSPVPCPSNGSESCMLPPGDCLSDRQDKSIRKQSSLEKDSVLIPVVDPHNNSTAYPTGDLSADATVFQSNKERFPVPCPSNSSDCPILPTKDSVPILVGDPHNRKDNSTAHPTGDLSGDMTLVQNNKECSPVPRPSNGSDSHMLPTRDCSTDGQDKSIKEQSSQEKVSVPVPVVDRHNRKDNSTVHPIGDLQVDVALDQSDKDCSPDQLQSLHIPQNEQLSVPTHDESHKTPATLAGVTDELLDTNPAIDSISSAGHDDESDAHNSHNTIVCVMDSVNSDPGDNGSEGSNNQQSDLQGGKLGDKLSSLHNQHGTDKNQDKIEKAPSANDVLPSVNQVFVDHYSQEKHESSDQQKPSPLKLKFVRRASSSNDGTAEWDCSTSALPCTENAEGNTSTNNEKKKSKSKRFSSEDDHKHKKRPKLETRAMNIDNGNRPDPCKTISNCEDGMHQKLAEVVYEFCNRRKKYKDMNIQVTVKCEPCQAERESGSESEGNSSGSAKYQDEWKPNLSCGQMKNLYSPNHPKKKKFLKPASTDNANSYSSFADYKSHNPEFQRQLTRNKECKKEWKYDQCKSDQCHCDRCRCDNTEVETTHVKMKIPENIENIDLMDVIEIIDLESENIFRNVRMKNQSPVIKWASVKPKRKKKYPPS